MMKKETTDDFLETFNMTKETRNALLKTFALKEELSDAFQEIFDMILYLSNSDCEKFFNASEEVRNIKKMMTSTNVQLGFFILSFLEEESVYKETVNAFKERRNIVHAHSHGEYESVDKK